MKKWKTGLCWVLMLVLLCGNASAAVNLKKGSLSWDVLFAEERLSQLGYNPGAADGAYDADTADAVKAFQKDRGLKETGAVKDDTWNALFDETYKLEYNAGIGQRDYAIRGKMPARFAKVEIKGSKSGRQDQADFSDLPGTSSIRVMLMVRDEPMDEIVAACQNHVRETFDKEFTAQYSGQNFKQGKVKTSQINGKPVQMWQTTWNFSNGGKLTRYWYYGVMELDPVGEHQAYLTANLAYNLVENTKSMDKALGQKVIQETLENVRCDRDRLYEYQAGAAKRLKASRLKKFTLPEFMPVDETEQSTLDIIYEIWHYVDPAADGTQGEMTGETCVSMYYGAKIMNWFMYYVNRGNRREDCRMESVMSLANSVFYDDFRAARPEIRDKLAAAMSAAKLALNEENEPYLTLLGLEKPEWTAEELDIMTRSLVGVMDDWIEKEKQTAETAETGTPEPARETATPEPTEEPAMPEPAKETATPEPAEEPATPDPASVEVLNNMTQSLFGAMNNMIGSGNQAAESAETAAPEPTGEPLTPEPVSQPENKLSADEKKWICPDCGEECLSNFCPNCGAPSPAPTTTEPPAPADADSDRKESSVTGTENAGGDSLLRFDGLYHYRNEDEKYTAWLKFYPDGKVTGVSTTGGTAAKINTWIDDHEDSGTYTIEGDQIKFDITSEPGVVSYSGTIQDASTLILDIVSHINGHTAQGKVYTFDAY